MRPGRLVQVAVLGGAAWAGGYWLYRYLKPERSTLALNRSVVVITGASSGIGRAYASAFARRGASLVLVARRAELLDAVQQEIAPYAADVLIVPADITEDAQLQAVAESTLERFGHVDVLINNAGTNLSGMLHEDSITDIRALLEVNLAAAICLTRLFLPSMLARRAGHIVNVASALGRLASPVQAVYSASKAGLISFSDSMRRQLDGTGVSVMTVIPSFTYTDSLNPRLERWVKQMGLPIEAPEYVAERTIDGLLKFQTEVYFGGAAMRFAMWLDRHCPRLADLLFRLILTPEQIAAA